ncbi:hypothetical protein CLHOM_08180 [Clostridium homopropionicum DSM 5847]|uniref:Uncharacterized protein n=1 Tax=Clostridium homopropionicum DSM 5847 TaxID=1121318 RepID=A0A0L6ZCI2_9CLOT|nr:hypothetical protein [Clostridium homopropionicum]KOA20676.1 hypothetical protein CLHOM_08180 [Clostridium homopropionicum DSM 5847]SFF91722.1 hypothetical protein SAMN04488501_103184 [Clostridium homopropionicum]
MEEYDVSLNGITNPLNIPKKFKNIPNTTLYKKNIIDCNEKLINLRKILSIDIVLDINNGFKNKNNVSIIGDEKISITYIQNTFNNDVKKVNYKFPFIGEIQYPIENFKVNQVYAAVTKLKYKLTNSKNIVLENWIFLAPLINELDSHTNSNIQTNSNLENIDLNNNKGVDIIIDYDMNLDN